MKIFIKFKKRLSQREYVPKNWTMKIEKFGGTCSKKIKILSSASFIFII